MISVNTQLMDELIAHSLFSGRYSTSVAKRMVKVLNEFDAELTATLITVLDDADIDINSFTVRRLESLLSSVERINGQAIERAFAFLSDEMKAYAFHEVSFYPSLFNALLPDAVLRHYPFMGISEEMLYASAMSRPFQGKLLSEWASGLEKDRMTRISNTVRNGYLNGDSAVQIGRKIRGHVKQNYKDGALQMSRANATTLAKTAINHVQTEFLVTGVKVQYKPHDIDGTLILATDIKMVFSPATVIQKGDRVFVDGVWLRVQEPNPIKPAELVICYQSQLRA